MAKHLVNVHVALIFAHVHILKNNASLTTPSVPPVANMVPSLLNLVTLYSKEGG